MGELWTVGAVLCWLLCCSLQPQADGVVHTLIHRTTGAALIGFVLATCGGDRAVTRTRDVGGSQRVARDEPAQSAPDRFRLPKRVLRRGTRQELTPKVPGALRKACRRVARRSPERRMPVHCVPLVPRRPLVVLYAGPIPGADSGDESSYAVDLASKRLIKRDRTQPGHWRIEAGPASIVRQGLPRKTLGPGKRRVLAGRNVRLYRIRARGPRGVHFGHAVARWRLGRTLYQLSIHDWSNRSVGLTMAEAWISLLKQCPLPRRGCPGVVD